MVAKKKLPTPWTAEALLWRRIRYTKPNRDNGSARRQDESVGLYDKCLFSFCKILKFCKKLFPQPNGT